MAHNIDQIIMSLQFQDVTRQEIETAMAPLKQIGSFADDVVIRLGAADLHGNAKAASTTASPQAKVPPAKAAAPATPAQKPATVTKMPEAKKPEGEKKEGEENEGGVAAGDFLFF